MGRSNFGGAGDYSGTFASLFNQAKSQAEARQAAEDQDEYDQWKNGLISDEDWLDYIDQRIKDTSKDSDPTQHEHWVKAQRQYQTSIADNRAEFAYSNGGSINDLIAYYQARLLKSDPGSQDYRNLQLRINGLQDQRASDDISTGAQKIADQIDKGKASYQDLLDFYKSKVGGLRNGSDLKKQVQAEIGKTRTTIRDSKVAGVFERLQYDYEGGRLGGGAYAAKLRDLATQYYKKSDPQKYYQILEAAQRLSKGGSSGGGGGGRSGGGSSKASGVGQLRALQQYFNTISTAYEKGSKFISDPADPSRKLALTPDLIKAVDHQQLQTFDKIAAIHKAQGRMDYVLYDHDAKSKYITEHVQPHNTLPAADQWNQLLGSQLKIMDAVGNDADPAAMFETVANMSSTLGQWIQGHVTKTKSVTGRGSKGTSNKTILPDEQQLSADFIGNASDFVNGVQSILADQNMSAADASKAISDLFSSLDSDSSAGFTKGTISAMKDWAAGAVAIRNTHVDLASGKKVLSLFDPKTGEPGLNVVDTYEQTVHVPNGDGTYGDQVVRTPLVKLGKGERLQEVWIDVAGKPTKTMAKIVDAPNPYQVWTLSKTVNGLPKGHALTSSEIDKLKSSGDWDALVSGGSVKKQDAFKLKAVQVPAYNDQGVQHGATTWYQDPETHLWYQSNSKGILPIRGVKTNDDGTISVDDKGNPQIDWSAMGHVGGVSVPYAGRNQRLMQAEYVQGNVGTDPTLNSYDPQDFRYRDINGNVTDDPGNFGLGDQYWNPIYSHHADQALDDTPYGLDRWDLKADQAKVDFVAKQQQEAISAGHAQTSDDVITQMGKRLGIDLTSPAQKQAKPFVPPKPGNATPQDLSRLPAGEMASLLPKIQPKANPRIPFEDLMPATTPGASSGPAIADLPSGKAGTKIDPSKIVVPKINPKLPPDELSGGHKKKHRDKTEDLGSRETIVRTSPYGGGGRA